VGKLLMMMMTTTTIQMRSECLEESWKSIELCRRILLIEGGKIVDRDFLDPDDFSFDGTLFFISN
jgi:hypothetical protein